MPILTASTLFYFLLQEVATTDHPGFWGLCIPHVGLLRSCEREAHSLELGIGRGRGRYPPLLLVIFEDGGHGHPQLDDVAQLLEEHDRHGDGVDG
eukprot:scaffold4358_cov137-Isochrysis_galbana.AAC.2